MPTTELAQLEADLEHLERQHYCNAMSDDFYYSNGGYAAMQRQIDAVKRQIRELQN